MPSHGCAITFIGENDTKMMPFQQRLAYYIQRIVTTNVHMLNRRDANGGDWNGSLAINSSRLDADIP